MHGSAWDAAPSTMLMVDYGLSSSMRHIRCSFAPWAATIVFVQCSNSLLSQGIPHALIPELTVEHYMDVRSNASRMAYDHEQDRMYYLRTNGDILMVLDDGFSTPTDTLLFTVDDHTLGDAYGLAFQDSDLFVIGNHVMGNTTQGMLWRAHLQPDGSRSWSVVARTEDYAWGGKAHGFNNVVVSPDGQWLYLNCGSRTDHGEVQSVNGAFPGLREEPITAKILRVPSNAVDLLLPNDETALQAGGFIYASGVRNTYDMAFDADGHLFGVENSGDHDDPEELNWLQQGGHYGFPWTAGGNPNPTRVIGYEPANDPLLNTGYPSATTDFYYDSTFPLPLWVDPTEPVRNTGPDGDRLRDPANGGIVDASDQALPMTTFTCHRSPLGLVFDEDGSLSSSFQFDGFLLSFTPGGDTLGYSPIAPWGIPVVPADTSEDLLHLQFSYDDVAGTFTVQTTRIAEGFYLPVDAALVGHVLYVIEHWGSTQRSIWKVTFPVEAGVPEQATRPGSLYLWPVPAHDHVTWRTNLRAGGTLQLFDMMGSLIEQHAFSLPTGTLDLQGIAPGVYTLRGTSPDGNTCQRSLVVD